MTDFPATIELCHARLATARTEFAKLQDQLKHWKGKAGELQALFVYNEAVVRAVQQILGGDACERPPEHPLVAVADETMSLAARAVTLGRLAEHRHELLYRLHFLITGMATPPQSLAESVGAKQDWVRVLTEVRTAIEEPRGL